MSTLIFERQKLYEEIWADPVSTVCARYGLSDNGLRKICKALGVPMPELGYWSKLRAGYAVKKTPLRKHNGPIKITADPAAHTFRGKSPPNLQRVEREIRADGNHFDSIFVVDENASYRTPWVRELARQLERFDRTWSARENARAKRSFDYERVAGEEIAGGLIVVGSDAIAVEVTRNTRKRALSIADVFLRAIQERGFAVRVVDGKTLISNLDIEGQFRISEIIEKSNDSMATRGWKATGKLRLSIRAVAFHRAGIPQQMIIRDELKKPLESRLGGVLARLRISLLGYEARVAAAREEERVEAERQARYNEAARLRAIDAEKRRREQERCDSFFKEVEFWEASERRRQYIDHIEEIAKRNGLLANPSTTASKWIAWARRANKTLDPTDERFETFLDGPSRSMFAHRVQKTS